MINQKQSVFMLMCLYTLANTPVASCNTSSVIYVAGDGTGNYNCNGTNDQVQINQALSYAVSHPGTTVYLKGPFVYDIESSCLIGSNTELTGDSSAKLRLADYIGWTTASAGTPMIGQIGGKGTVVHDIKIHGFEIDGNEGAQSGSGGKDLYRIISFQGSSSAPVYNIYVYKMNLHDAKGEGFRCSYGKNIYYYDNVGNNLQHTCVMYSRVNTGEIHNNVAHQCSCAGDRLDNCQNIIIDNETISPYSGVTTYVKDSKGYAVSDTGMQICNAASSPATSNIIIRDCNIMSGVNGILFDSLNDASNVNCYDNFIHDSGYENEGVSQNGCIGITHCGNGITIQNNDITGSYVAGINVNSASSNTCTVTVVNNNIMNGKTGYAIKNSVASQVSVILTHNYLYKNPADFYPSSLVNMNQATFPNSKISKVTALVQPIGPTANFSSNITNGYAPLTVTFTNTSTGTPTSWSWNFGDGTTSTIQNPTRIYSKAGTYTVKLTVTNAAGSNTATKFDYITVKSVSQKPVAAFSATPISGTIPLTVQFTDSSKGSPDSWRWTFGDGQTSTQQNPTHTYNKVGKYTITLAATNTAGSNSVTESGYINVIAPSKPSIAAFSTSQTSGKAPLKVTFTDKSTNTPTSWAWNFGDGTSSTAKNPVHIYSKAGKYIVTLTVKNSKGSNAKTMSSYITVK